MEKSSKGETNVKQKTKEEKLEIVQKTIDKLNKVYGAGTVSFLDKLDVQIEKFSTTNISIDLALGGGLPKGRIVEIYGPESSGKTTLTLHIIKSVQESGGIAAFIDAEHAFDMKYAGDLGIDFERLFLAQPSSGEEALQIAEELIESGAISVCVIDSVAALVPKAELDGEMGDAKIGLQARLMSQGLRKLTGVVNKTNTLLIFINQIRDKIGVSYGSPHTTSGGNALKFFASQRIEIAKTGLTKDNYGDVEGTNVKLKIVKNKIAPPFKTAEATIFYGKGFGNVLSILDLAVDLNIIQKRGAYYKYKEETIGHGEKACLELLEDNPDIVEILREEILENLKNKN